MTRTFNYCKECNPYEDDSTCEHEMKSISDALERIRIRKEKEANGLSKK